MTAGEAQGEPRPILYSFRRCPYAMRARLALLVSRQEVELREVVLRDKPPALLAASPKGTVPVLHLPDGQVIDQSLDIMLWALQRNDPDDWLDGHDADLLARNDGPFKHHLDRYKYPERHGSDPAVHRAEALRLLTDLEERLTGAGYLTGGRLGLTDIAIFPFLRQFAAVDPPWFEAQSLPHLRQWLGRLVESPLFQQAMIRFPAWREGQEPVCFPPDTSPK